MCLIVRAGWSDKVEKVPEWRGLLDCLSCNRRSYHFGFPVKRKITLYGIPTVSVGHSGYVMCGDCGSGNYNDEKQYQAVGRSAAANLAAHQASGTPFPPELHNVNLQELGLKRQGAAGYGVTDWRGNKVAAALSDVLSHPNNFILTPAQQDYIVRWREANPQPPERCSTCGRPAYQPDEPDEETCACGGGVLLT